MCLGTSSGTAKGEIDEYITILAEIADTSGGGLTDPPQAVGDCPDWEDNHILDLALAVPDAPGADITVKPPNQTIPAQPWISLGF
jgi:hypothetical protein